MWPFKSNSKKQSPEQPGDDAFRDASSNMQKVLDILEAHQQDITTLNTAVNRIERKQNRWLEVLNSREISANVDEHQPPAASIFERLEVLAGEPTDE